MSSCHKRRDVILKRVWGRQMTGAIAQRVIYRPITALYSPKRDMRIAIGQRGFRETEAPRREERELTSRLPIEPDGHDLRPSARH